jgi:hypothetical protein
VFAGAALLLAVAAVPFAGMDIFHVNEWFFTPRLIVSALVLLALERYLAGRRLVALGLALAGLPLHPLMALPGALIVATLWLYERLGMRRLAVLIAAGTVALLGLLLNPPLAGRLLGTMTPPWRDSLHHFVAFNFPLRWEAGDWVRLGLSLAVAPAACRWLTGGPVRHLLMATAFVAVAGMALAVLADFLPYALLIQGQAYRWAWPLDLLLYPLGCLGIARLWSCGRIARIGAVLAAAYLGELPLGDRSLWLAAAAGTALAVLWWRGLRRAPATADWVGPAAVTALVVTVLGLHVTRLAALLSQRHRFALFLDGFEFVTLAARLLGPLTWLAVALVTAALLRRLLRGEWRFALAAGALGFVVALGFFAVPQSPAYAEHASRWAADVRFVRGVLAAKGDAGRTPTVYWPNGQVRFLWFDLGVNSYFSWHQVAGTVFSADTAAEGTRRARLVSPFEMDYLRRAGELLSPALRRRFAYMSRHGRDESEPPGRDDVLALCRDERLDFVVLPDDYGGLAAAGNGHVFVYDCRALRAHLAALPPTGELP